MSAENELSRLLALVPWLLAHRDATVAATAEHFGVSTSRIADDLGLLSLTGPGWEGGELIDIQIDDDGYISVFDPQALSRPLAFTIDEATALIVGLQLLEQVPGPHDPSVLTGLSARLQEIAGDAGTAGSSVAVVSEPAGDIEATIAVITSALTNEHRVSLRYLSGTRDEVTDRDVDPMWMFSAGGHTYLRGWCHRAESIRTFRVDRIVSASELEQAAEPPIGDTPIDLGTGLLRPEGEPVTLDLAPSAAWVAEAYPVTSLERKADGTTRVVMNVADREWAIRLILGLGGAASVVDSPDLTEAISSRARAALALYT